MFSHDGIPKLCDFGSAIHASSLKNDDYVFDVGATRFTSPEIINGTSYNHKVNKTGLQPVSRPVELVHFFGGWVEGASKQTDMSWADRKVCKIQQTDKTGGASRCYNNRQKFWRENVSKQRLNEQFGGRISEMNELY